MSDNFGSGQPRVLTTEDRSIENVVFQHKVPPLTSEWNLINQISNQKIKDVVKSNSVSGWLSVGNIVDLNAGISESSALPGDVCTSMEYPANSFKLVGQSTAIVDGLLVPVQECDIMLDEPTGGYDFVFLEVWKKLVGELDPIYPFGNVNAAPYADNELVYDTIGIETTKRVQVQYRIRSKKLQTFTGGSEGFDQSSIYPIGGRTSEYEYSNYIYTSKGSSDPGLYVSGSGSSVDQGILNTVDGYVYAIPMFIVYRRKEGSFPSDNIHSTTVTLGSYLTGYRSDRSDQKLLDVVYSTDLVDQRHKIVPSMSDISIAAEETFNKLVTGDLTTCLGKGFTNFTNGRSICSGASSQLKIDQLPAGELSSSSFKKNVYANAAVKKYISIVKISASGAWAVGVTDVSVDIPGPSVATITEVTGYYNPTIGELTGVSYNIATKEITVSSGSNIVGNSVEIYMQVNLVYTPGNNGLKDVPSSVLEVYKSYSQPIAPVSGTVPLRTGLTGQPLVFDGNGKDTVDGETDDRDCIINKGNLYSDMYDFGMDLVIHRQSSGSYTQTFTDGKLYSYYVTGVKEVLENTGTRNSPVWQQVNFTFSRIESSIETVNQTIDSYTIEGTVNQDIKIVFSISSKPDIYVNSEVVKDPVNSLKFFNFNRQGRGVTDVFEMIEVVAERVSGDLFMVDTIDKPIIKIGSTSSTPYIYSSPVGGPNTPISNFSVDSVSSSEINSKLPIVGSQDYSSNFLPTKIVISAAGLVGDYIRVPLLVESYISADELPYNVVYNFTPYQGLLSKDSIISGKFVSEGKALVTSKGSGSEDLFTMGSGTATFTQYTTSIVLPDPGEISWEQYLDTSSYTYYVRKEDDPVYYRVSSITGNTVTVSENYRGSSGDYNYEIVLLDTPQEGTYNIIDRMPTYEIKDYAGTCVDLEYGSDSGKSLAIPALTKITDPISIPINTFSIGDPLNANNDKSRGITDISLSSLNKRPAIKYASIGNTGNFYKKVFQPYLFMRVDSNKVAKPYLAIISSETGNASTINELNGFSDKDTIDLFEIIGRPIIKV
jgi:hypothetical protein